MREEVWRDLTLLEYYRRYNREEYERLKPPAAQPTQPNSDTSRGPLLEAKAPPVVVSNVVDELTLRKNMGNKILGIFAGKGAADRVSPYAEVNTANNSLLM